MYAYAAPAQNPSYTAQNQVNPNVRYTAPGMVAAPLQPMQRPVPKRVEKKVASARLAKWYPEQAAKLANLRFDDCPDDMAAQDRVREGYARAWLRQKEVERSGFFTRFVGRVTRIFTALTAVLVPVVIGLQGSFGTTDTEKLLYDQTLKYITIAISITGTVLTTVEKVVSWFSRGAKMELAAQKMERLLNDYLALCGPDFNPHFVSKSTDAEAEDEEAAVCTYTIPDLSGVPVSVLEAHVAHLAALKAEREDLERRAAAGDEHRRRAEEAEAKRLELAARVAELEQLEGDLAELKELRAAKDLAQPAADAAPQREPGEGGAEPAATVDDQIAAKRLELAAFLAGHDPQAAFKVCDDPGRLLQPFEQSQLTPRAAPLKPSDAAPTRCSTKTPTASSRPRSCGTSCGRGGC